MSRPPLPPFTEESARLKVQAAEDAWNSRDPVRVSLFLLRLTARFAALHVSAEWLRAHDLAAARQPQSESTQ